LSATGKAAIVGGGVIGGGWSARFLLHGWDVSVFDPAPDAQRKIHAVLDNARRSLPALANVPMPPEGRLRFADRLEEAVAGADWIQESVPERLAVKHKVFADIQRHAPAGAIIGSSTSGFKPSELQEGASAPGRILVAHPFNPVYLLPLVELVPGAATAEETVTRAAGILTTVGMKPLRVRREIDAHIADRFLEAVWREALWLVRDGIATTAEIDDAIRFGFGLRWAQMGLFETYRVAGGEAGMAHFIAQFGPCLKWPWTRLTDVPELTDELIRTIADQSDAQSGAHSIRELERIRDDNLVGILSSLKERNWGPGAWLRDHDDRLAAIAPTGAPTPANPEQPLRLREVTVPPSWIDYNGHMTEHRYLQLFGETSDALLRLIGVDADYLAGGRSYYTVETHIIHVDEVRVGQQLYSTTQILAVDDKRLHLFHRIHGGSDDRLIASAEQMLLHVDSRQGRAAAADDAVLARLNPIAQAHAALARPEAAGRQVGRRS
jgi:carnitine 3-dehydrogenase